MTAEASFDNSGLSVKPLLREFIRKRNKHNPPLKKGELLFPLFCYLDLRNIRNHLICLKYLVDFRSNQGFEVTAGKSKRMNSIQKLKHNS